MQMLHESRRFTLGAAKALLCAALLFGGFAGCGNTNLSEKLRESLLTSKQRQRIESEPEAILSVRVSDADGHGQSMALVQFDKDWKAQHAKDEGIPGFVVRNWLFVGNINQQLIDQIKVALL